MGSRQDLGLISHLLEALEMSVLPFPVGKREQDAVFTCVVKKPDAL